MSTHKSVCGLRRIAVDRMAEKVTLGEQEGKVRSCDQQDLLC